MDTLTHALSGVLLARATGRASGSLLSAQRGLAAGIAAAFPDADYALFLLAPAEFLNLHRGATHSLLLLPLWAALLSVPLARLLGGRWRDYYGYCALGLAAHIVGDLVTVFGTQLFYPLSARPFALGISFDINPWIAALVALGCFATLGRHPRTAAGLTLLTIAVALGGQAALRQQALAAVADTQGTIPGAAIHALPQPFSPFRWRLVIVDAERYRVAQWEAFSSDSALAWIEHARIGSEPSATVREAWGHVGLAPFRQFARLPALYRVDQRGDDLCVWFQDLRYNFPDQLPTFRNGLCRASDGSDWRPYRLRYFSDAERQPL